MTVNDIIAPGANMAGLLRLFFCPVDLVTGIPDQYNQLANVVFGAGGRWFALYATVESLVFSEPSKILDGVPVYAPKLDGLSPKDNPTALPIFQDMECRRHIIKYTDNNCQVKLVGSFDAPLKFTLDNNSSAKTSGYNGYKFSFATESPFRALFYNGI